MKKPTPSKHQRFNSAVIQQVLAVAAFPKEIRRLVRAFSATYGGIYHMNLDAWRDLEQQLKRRIENEYLQRHY